MLLFTNPENAFDAYRKGAIENAFDAYRKGVITLDELQILMNDTALKYLEVSERLVKAMDEAKYWKEANEENYKLVLEKNEKLRKAEARIKELEGDA